MLFGWLMYVDCCRFHIYFSHILILIYSNLVINDEGKFAWTRLQAACDLDLTHKFSKIA